MRARAKSWLKDLLRPVGAEDPAPFLPYEPGKSSYGLPRVDRRSEGAVVDGSDLPVPPRDLWLGYGGSVQEYLDSGRGNVRFLLNTLEASGASLPAGSRVLDFGCGAGRMIRWLVDPFRQSEVWGADISAKHVFWCRQHLQPPFRFFVTTVIPHLPFEDRSFDLVYSQSVFTHIDDLAKTWFLEIRRILKPGGVLYATIHDRKTIELLDGEMRDVRFARRMHGEPDYAAFARSDFSMFTIGRSTKSQVFYDLEDLRADLEGVFRLRSAQTVPGGYQTALLLERA